jgi:multiple sugar transport system permease protein
MHPIYLIERCSDLDRKNKQLKVAALFLAPHFAGFLLFLLLPVLGTFGISLLDWNMITPPKFVGLKNYETMLTQDPFFKQAMVNTFFYTLGSVILIVGISLNK